MNLKSIIMWIFICNLIISTSAINKQELDLKQHFQVNEINMKKVRQFVFNILLIVKSKTDKTRKSLQWANKDW